METYRGPSIEEYARFHDLTRDHLQPHPLLHIDEARDVWQMLQDPSDLFSITPENATLPVERLAIGPETASFLAAIGSQAYKGLPSSLGEAVEFDSHRRRDLKRELPLLRRDPDCDLWLFARQIEPDFASEFLPFEALEEEADEALTWPSQTKSLPNEQWIKACSEKLAVSQEDLLYLQKTLKWHFDGGEHRTFPDDEGIFHHQKNKALAPSSPPLLPASPEMTPYEPSSDTCQVELLSEATDSIKSELDAIEEHVLGGEIVSQHGKSSPVASRASSQPLESPGSVYSPLKDLQEPRSSSPVTKHSMSQWKVEVPLSPPWSDQTPWAKQHASFADAMSEVIRDQPILIPASSSGGEEDIDTFFGSTIAPLATSAERSIEQEQLMEADTSWRVRVPVMDFSNPKAPWDSHYVDSLESLKMLQIKEIEEPRKHLWKSSGKAERELSWVPFPAALAKLGIDDISLDDGSTGAFLDYSDHLNSEDLVWKHEGLRILDESHDLDEEELEEGTFPDGNDLSSLVRKRKGMIDEENGLGPHSGSPKRVPGSKPEERPLSTTSSESKVLRSDSGAQAQARSRTPKQTTFVAFGALDSFMGMRSGTGDSLNFSKVGPQQAPKDSYSATRPPSAERAAARENGSIVKKSVVLPSPTIQVPKDKRQFMMSTAFLSHRGLMHRMLELYPTADIIERDFGLQSLEEKSRDNTVNHDADIIVSPSTGLLLTTMQKIKQRALPGQMSFSGVRDRISVAAPRYEQLIVLVRYDQADGDQMTQSDCEALAEFVGFCSRISSTDVSVKLVAGAEDHLVNWIIALVIEHSHSGLRDLLLPEETPWELFLRHAGLNAFAAQMILTMIRASSEHEQMSIQDSLSAFVFMALEEKLARFDSILGGKRALTRAHQVLETRW